MLGQNSWWGARLLISLVEFQQRNILRAIAFAEVFLMPYAVFAVFMWVSLMHWKCNHTNAITDVDLFHHKIGAKLALWHHLFIITFWHFAIHHVATLTPATCSTKFDSLSSHWQTTQKHRQSSRRFCTRQLASSAEWHHQRQFSSRTKWQAGHVLAKKV